ncbi:hypothetical protein LRS10_22155 [Phenylobacterium sp. J426]|uniref:hypothetical protein n=1 Tax=Phenylobacterium sp. J426 TaxID=2898439 RepID=UPI0021517C21|nr:hypothetical protein [Phenylobacterium sp. J426]MCR5876613.1 hypothetical protein [Phenylobacterium sp. J426]
MALPRCDDWEFVPMTRDTRSQEPEMTIVLRVRNSIGGWIVQDGATMGPFLVKEQALHLAHGMAAAIRRNGDQAEVIVEDD